MAFALDETLRELARCHTMTRRILGRGLARLDDDEGLMRLGYGGLNDFAQQELGLADRHWHELAAMEKKLRDYPALDAAYAAGRLGFSAVRLLLLLRTLPPDEEAVWAKAMEGYTVHEIEEALGKWKAARRAKEGVADAADAEGAAAAVADDPAGGESDPEERPLGRWIEVSATPLLAAKYDVAVEMARRLAERDVPVSECADQWIAAFLAGEGAEALARPGAESRAGEGESAADAAVDLRPVEEPEARARRLDFLREERRYWREVERDIADINHHWDFLSWKTPALDLPAGLECEEGLDPAAICRRLKEVANLARRTDRHFRRLLGCFVRARLYSDLDFVDLDHYARERLLGSPSAIRAQAALAWKLPFDLQDALEEGRVTEVQAAVLAPLLRLRYPPAGLGAAWIAHASDTTVRFLREDVKAARRLCREDYGRFCATFGLPASARRGPGRGGARTPRAWDADEAIAALEAGLRSEGGYGHAGDVPVFERAAGALQTCAEAAPFAASPVLQTCAGSAPASEAALGLPTFRDELKAVLAEIRGERDYPDDEGRRLELRFWLPAELEERWQTGCRAADAVYGACAGVDVCLDYFLDSYLATRGREALAAIRRHRILDLMGWRCAVPICSRREGLHEHHVKFRSHGGSDDAWNLAAVCSRHHLRGIHMNRVRVEGRSPDGLRWELGIEPGRLPHLEVHGRRIAGAAAG